MGPHHVVSNKPGTDTPKGSKRHEDVLFLRHLVTPTSTCAAPLRFSLLCSWLPTVCGWYYVWTCVWGWRLLSFCNCGWWWCHCWSGWAYGYWCDQAPAPIICPPYTYCAIGCPPVRSLGAGFYLPDQSGKDDGKWFATTPFDSRPCKNDMAQSIATDGGVGLWQKGGMWGGE